MLYAQNTEVLRKVLCGKRKRILSELEEERSFDSERHILHGQEAANFALSLKDSDSVANVVVNEIFEANE